MKFTVYNHELREVGFVEANSAHEALAAAKKNVGMRREIGPCPIVGPAPETQVYQRTQRVAPQSPQLGGRR